METVAQKHDTVETLKVERALTELVVQPGEDQNDSMRELALLSRCEKASSRFDVALTKTPCSRAVGVSLDRSASEYLQVVQVNKGLIEEHNKAAPDGSKIVPGCFIMQVNKTSGDAQAMLDTMRKNDQLTLRVAPKEEVLVEFDKGRQGCGLDLFYMPEATVMVVRSVKDGPAKRFNDAVKVEREKLRLFDRIEKVNDVAGSPAAMLAELEKATRVSLMVTRPAE